MEIIQYHDMTSAEYENATLTSVIGGSTWLRMPKIYGCETIWFVAAEIPVQIRQYFWDNPEKTLQVAVHMGVLPDHA